MDGQLARWCSGGGERAKAGAARFACSLPLPLAAQGQPSSPRSQRRGPAGYPARAVRLEGPSRGGACPAGRAVDGPGKAAAAAARGGTGVAGSAGYQIARKKFDLLPNCPRRWPRFSRSKQCAVNHAGNLSCA